MHRENEREVEWGCKLSKPTLGTVYPAARHLLRAVEPLQAAPTGAKQSNKYMNLEATVFIQAPCLAWLLIVAVLYFQNSNVSS